ncbi:hypothetical protein SeMB42_g04811 [Synchytrium endobioticum]|nr:hypothetical protein SeMB42_g04811 [Synchytrium endobioticum]
MGSGGHTSEMMHLLHHIPKHHFTPRIYVIAATDILSAAKVGDIESDQADVAIRYIPRSREVGQSWLTTVCTTTYACCMSAILVWDVWPDIIICNGPGTCVPIIVAAHLVKILGIKSVAVVFVESFARVQSLSLTGRILYALRLADVFVVQWEQLREKYVRAMYCGRLV